LLLLLLLLLHLAVAGIGQVRRRGRPGLEERVLLQAGGGVLLRVSGGTGTVVVVAVEEVELLLHLRDGVDLLVLVVGREIVRRSKVEEVFVGGLGRRRRDEVRIWGYREEIGVLHRAGFWCGIPRGMFRTWRAGSGGSGGDDDGSGGGGPLVGTCGWLAGCVALSTWLPGYLTICLAGSVWFFWLSLALSGSVWLFVSWFWICACACACGSAGRVAHTVLRVSAGCVRMCVRVRACVRACVIPGSVPSGGRQQEGQTRGREGRRNLGAGFDRGRLRLYAGYGRYQRMAML
jgi:hypothetical protein